MLCVMRGAERGASHAAGAGVGASAATPVSVSSSTSWSSSASASTCSGESCEQVRQGWVGDAAGTRGGKQCLRAGAGMPNGSAARKLAPQACQP